MSELLTCEGLTKSYQKGTNALDSIDLHIGFGRIVGLLGPNGSGKTTLIKLANGLLQPTSGSIKVAGMAPGPDTKALLSYLPDADWLPDWMRVEQLVEMFRDFYGTPSQAKAYIGFDADKANEMLARLNIAPNARLKTLSKGNKEKVQLILAMSRNARLYLLDEPIGGVDPAARDYILNTILTNYSRDASVIISTHLIEDVEPVLDEAVFLKNGKPSKFNCVKWQFLLDAPFKVSEQCCDVMKKRPFHKYQKETGQMPIVATMADESMMRKNSWMKYGCNAFDRASGPQSRPMSFWTERDVLEYLIKYDVPYASV